MATNNKTMGQSWLRPITKWSNLPIDDVLFQQNKLLSSLLKLGTNIENLSNSLLEWSKHERNPAYYDVFTNWYKLDSALCSLLYALHNQCNNFRATFKMIKKKHKIIDTYRKKNEDKKTEIRRIRTKMNTLKRVHLKRKETYVKLQAELNQALEDQKTTTDTLLIEINNLEITKARMVKDGLIGYSQCWTKFTIDSQHVFGAQSQIALEMTGKPDRRTTYTDDNRLIAENALQKLNMGNAETDSESFKSSQSDISQDIPSRRLPAIPPNQQNIYQHQRPELKQSSESVNDDDGHIYQVTETDRDTDLSENKVLENDAESYRSSTSSVASTEDEILSESDYIVPNNPTNSDKGEYTSSLKGSQETVSPEKLESISVPVSTLGDDYLQIIDQSGEHTVYQDIYQVAPREQHCEDQIFESSSELGDDIYHDISSTENDCENQDTALSTTKLCNIYEDVSPKKNNLKRGNHSPSEKNNDDADLCVLTTGTKEVGVERDVACFEEEYVVPDIHVSESDSEFPDNSIYAVCLSEDEKYANKSSANTASAGLYPKKDVEDDILKETYSTFDNVPLFYENPIPSTVPLSKESISILPPRVRSKPVTGALIKRFSRIRDKKVKSQPESPDSNVIPTVDDLSDGTPKITRQITKPPLMKKPGNKLKNLEKDGSRPV